MFKRALGLLIVKFATELFIKILKFLGKIFST